jgi:hypothetical protein
VTNKEKPYVLGTRLRVNHDKIAEIEDPLDHDGLLVIQRRHLPAVFVHEKWDAIPPQTRYARHAGRRPPTPTSMRFSTGKKDLGARGAIPATAPKAERTPAKEIA